MGSTCGATKGDGASERGAMSTGSALSGVGMNSSGSVAGSTCSSSWGAGESDAGGDGC